MSILERYKMLKIAFVLLIFFGVLTTASISIKVMNLVSKQNERIDSLEKKVDRLLEESSMNEDFDFEKYKNMLQNYSKIFNDNISFEENNIPINAKVVSEEEMTEDLDITDPDLKLLIIPLNEEEEFESPVYDNVKTLSNYTENQYNYIITEIMKENGYSEDQICASQLYNTGSFFETFEKVYEINGAFALAVAMFESGFGTSKLSMNKNNLFGINSRHGYKEFDSVVSNIYYFGDLISEGYLQYGLDQIDEIANLYCGDPKVWTTKVRELMLSFDLFATLYSTQ